MDEPIDYERLSSLVANKLRERSMAYAMAQNELLENNWLHDQFVSFVDAYAPLIARRVTATSDYNETFKVKLKHIISTIY